MARLLLKFKAVFDGFRLVLIGDIYELPIVHLSTKASELSVQDWSADVRLVPFEVLYRPLIYIVYSFMLILPSIPV